MHANVDLTINGKKYRDLEIVSLVVLQSSLENVKNQTSCDGWWVVGGASYYNIYRDVTNWL